MGEQLTHVPLDTDWHPTRRTLLSVAAAVSASKLFYDEQSRVVQASKEIRCAYDRSQDRVDRYDEINRYRLGFTEDHDLLDQVSSSISIDSIAADGWGEYKESTEEIFSGEILIDKPTYTVIEVSSNNDSNYALRPLEIYHTYDNIDHEEKVDEYILPLQLTDKVNRGYSLLYTQQPGRHNIKVNGTGDNSQGLNGNNINVRLLKVEGTDFAMQLLNNLQRIHIRPDNIRRIKHNMPVAADLRLGVNQSRQLLAEYWESYTGQDGGTSFCIADKPDDYEFVSFAKYFAGGQLIERKTQKGIHHRLEAIINQRDFQVATKNNVPGLEIVTSKMFALIPDIFVFNKDERESLRIGRKVFAFRERAQKDELFYQDEMLKIFIKNELEGIDLIRAFANY